MNDKAIKSAFVSGKTVFIKGKAYTKMYTQQEVKAIKNTPVRSNEELKEMDKRMEQYMKEVSPDFHKKLYPEQYKD